MESDLRCTRDKVAARFAAVLSDDTLGKHLEIVLYNWTLETCARDGVPCEWRGPFRYRYTSKALGLELFNLKTNATLRANVCNKVIPLKRLVRMLPHEMDPGKWEAAFAAHAKRQLRRMAATISVEHDTLFQCSRCKSKRCVSMQLQTRSADEPMTTYVNCTACGKKWKVS